MIGIEPDAPARVQPTPVETVLPGEDDAIDCMIAGLKRQLEERYVDRGALVRRDAHPKTLGLVSAVFTVDPDCPKELQHGVFATPGRRYDALIRYSNGNPELQHDLAPDVRGMAIKLPEVPSEFFEGGQDFLLATAQAFFGSSVLDYVGFIKASTSMFKTLLYFMKPSRWRAGVQLFRSLRIPKSPLVLEYFSQTPYRLGPHCVKYGARPVSRRCAHHDPWFMLPGIRHLLGLLARIHHSLAVVPKDVVGAALVEELRPCPVRFDFLVQRWPDLSQLPTWAIENPTRAWTAPWEKVATIDIPVQEGIAERAGEAERMRFSPWHALRVHQPLGGINRARRRIYQEMSSFRNSHNH